MLTVAKHRGVCMPQIFGILHFFSGCDYLSHLRGFSEIECCKALIKHIDFIIPEHFDLHVLLADDKNNENNSCFNAKESLFELMNNENDHDSLSALVDNIRKRTWLKTYVLLRIGMTRQGFQDVIEVTEWAWELKEDDTRKPIWDTDENITKVDMQRQAVMQKCGCKNTMSSRETSLHLCEER